MQVFNTFFKILKSKLFLAMIYIPVFIAVMLGMTLTDGGTSSVFEQERLKVCIFDEDDTPESRALIGFISERNKLKDLENDRDKLTDALYYGTVDYAVTIKKGYAEKLAAGDTAGLFESMRMHDSYSTVYMGQMLNEYVSTVSAYIAGGSDVMSAVTKTGEAMLKEAEVTVVSFDENSGAVFSPKASFYFRFLIYALIGLTMSMLCPVLLVMNRKDIRYRTNCSGIRPGTYTVQIFAGSIIYILLTWLIFMVIGVAVNGGMYHGLQWLAVLNSFVFELFAAMLTILIASFDPSITLINIIIQIISIGMCFISGVFIEIDLLGEGVVAASRFMPAYWYIRVNRMLDGSETFDASTAALSIAIEAGFAAVLAILTLLIRRVRYSGMPSGRPRTASAA